MSTSADGTMQQTYQQVWERMVSADADAAREGHPVLFWPLSTSEATQPNEEKR